MSKDSERGLSARLDSSPEVSVETSDNKADGLAPKDSVKQMLRVRQVRVGDHAIVFSEWVKVSGVTEPSDETAAEPVHVDPPEDWHGRVDRLTRKGF